MARPIEDPTVTSKPGPGGLPENVTTHPAFGQIGASRVSGRTNLYDSDFSHNAYMTISIRRSELHRNLANDWHYGREELIEVALSEAQWATFVSSANIGSGVPCTIEHLRGEVIPGLPAPASRVKQFGDEVRKRGADSIEALDKLAAEIDGLGLSRAKADKLKEVVRAARSAFTSSIPYIAEQFDEHSEKTVERAKAEIHGYMTGVLTRSGLAALGAELPLQIEGSPLSAHPGESFGVSQDDIDILPHTEERVR